MTRLELKELSATLETAWVRLIPDVNKPSHFMLADWAKKDDGSGFALTAIERTAERHAREPLVNAIGWCASALNNAIKDYWDKWGEE